MSWKIRLSLICGVVFIVFGCDEPTKQEEVASPVVINAQYLDKLRYPGEVVRPRDIYDRAYRNALRNITVENMEERLTDIERNVNTDLEK